MKLVDHIETQERVEKLTEEQRDDLFTKLVMGKDVIETAETSRGKFEIKYPKTAEIMAIGKLAAMRRGYKPPEAFDAETEMLNLATSTLDVITVSGPEWYENAKKRDQNYSFAEVPSRAFIYELYGKAYSFREEVEQQLNPGKGTGDKPVSAEEGDDVSVDGGAFGNLTNKPDGAKPR